MTPEIKRLLTALGHDPETHTAERMDKGLVVFNARREVVRFYTPKRLLRLKTDADFLRTWEAAG